MIGRSFYTFAEARGQLGVDDETLRQAIVEGKVSIYLHFKDHFVTWPEEADWEHDDNESPIRVQDRYATWKRSKEKDDTDWDTGALIKSGEMGYTLNGWFRVSQRDAKAAALGTEFKSPIRMCPTCTPTTFEPWQLWFKSKNVHRYLRDIWFSVADIDALATMSEADGNGTWPWGDHDTKLLRALAAAAKEWWSGYESEKPGTAPTNDEVAEWLHTVQGVSERNARVMATILRADDLKDGPRPKS